MSNGITPARRGSTRRDAVEARLEVALASHADDLVGDLSVLKEEQGGDGANAIGGVPLKASASRRWVTPIRGQPRWNRQKRLDRRRNAYGFFALASETKAASSPPLL